MNNVLPHELLLLCESPELIVLIILYSINISPWECAF